MAKVQEANFNVGIAKIPLQYAQGNGPNLQPIAAGLADMGQAFARVEAEQKAKADTMKRYNALSSFGDFEVNSKLKLQQTLDNADPADTSTAQKAIDDQITYENEFIKTLPPDLQPEFKVRADSVRGSITLDAHSGQDKLNNTYYKNDISNTQNTATIDVSKDPNTMEKWKSDLYTKIDNSGLSEAEKYFAKQNADRVLETAGYGATVKQEKLSAAQYTNDMATAASTASKQLGISPVDLLTVISYETGGTFNVNQKGGAGGRYKGLIQFGPEEQRKYGIHDGMSVGEQMGAVVQFLQDRGFKPGMTIYDLYSTINAGSPGHYNASDAHNGGAPGTVADKVRTQMAGHRAKAEALLGGKFEIPSTIDSDPRFQNVLYEDRVALQNDASIAVNRELAAMQAERKAQQEAQFNDLMVGINDGRYGQSDLEKGREDGWLTDYTQINQAQELLAKKGKAAAETKDLTARIERGDAFDPTNEADKKGFNNINELSKGEDRLQGMDSTYIEKSVGPLFRQTGMIAPDVVKTLGSMGNSNDGRKVTYAYTALNALEEQNPDAYIRNVPEAIRKRADIFQALSDGAGVNQALEWMKTSPDPAIRAAQAQLRTDAEKQLAEPKSKVNFDQVLSAFGADQASPGLKGAAMEQEWKTLVVENVVNGNMTLEQGAALATKQLARVWGKSNFGGMSTLMRLPPEKYAPDIGDGGAYRDRQARADFAVKPDEQMQLISDHTTEAEVAQGQNPSWLMMIKGSDGLWRPAMGPPDMPKDFEGKVADGNIDLFNRPQVKTPEGTATVRSISYQNDKGQEVLIPTVSNEGTIMSNEEAIQYWAAKGQNLGVFKDAKSADAYAELLHSQQEAVMNGVQVMKRQQFMPTRADKELKDKSVAVEQLQNEIKSIENSGQKVGRGGTQALPPSLQHILQQKKEQLGALQGVQQTVKQQTESQYRTPEGDKLDAAQKKIAPLERELQGFAGTMTYDEAMAQWKKADEYRQLKQEILQLTPIVQSQTASKRKQQGTDNAGN